MSTKEWLSRALRIDNEIKALEQEAEKEKARATTITARYNDIKVQTSNGNNTEDAIVKYIDYIKKIENKIDERYDVKREIFEAISKVDNPTYRTLLTLRYLQFMTWERIAEAIDYESVKWVRTSLHMRALDAVKRQK